MHFAAKNAIPTNPSPRYALLAVTGLVTSQSRPSHGLITGCEQVVGAAISQGCDELVTEHVTEVVNEPVINSQLL